jgi:hypothetical protein
MSFRSTKALVAYRQLLVINSRIQSSELFKANSANNGKSFKSSPANKRQRNHIFEAWFLIELYLAQFKACIDTLFSV